MKRLLFLLLLLTITFLAGCTKSTLPADSLFTNVAYSQSDLFRLTSGFGHGMEFQGTSYAEIRAADLTAFTSRYRSYLFNALHVSISEVQAKAGWQPQFNCVLFSEAYVVLAGSELSEAAFHTSVTVIRPAALVVFYIPDDAPIDPLTNRREAHSIVLLLTDQGPKFIEPQMSWTDTGEVHLSATELASIYYKRA